MSAEPKVMVKGTLAPDKFCYWLQGFAELNSEPPTREQWQEIKRHLEMVFDKEVEAPPKITVPRDGGAIDLVPCVTTSPTVLKKYEDPAGSFRLIC